MKAYIYKVFPGSWVSNLQGDIGKWYASIASEVPNEIARFFEIRRVVVCVVDDFGNLVAVEQ